MFYDILKDLCATNNTNVTALCKTLGITSANTGPWKRGKIPGAEILQRIADYFDVSVDYLLGRERTKAPTVSETAEALDDMLQEVLGHDPSAAELEKFKELAKLFFNQFPKQQQ